MMGALLGACAAGKASEPAAASYPAPPPAPAGAAQPQQPPSTPTVSPSTQSQPGTVSTDAPHPPTDTKPSADSTRPSSRALALSQAGTEVESSQRELDVAGGDCRNACRALGSMDRAAGRICSLAQSEDEQRRCGDAKTRVYSARDKVRTTCGTCPDVSVDRTAPIPSR